MENNEKKKKITILLLWIISIIIILAITVMVFWLGCSILKKVALNSNEESENNLQISMTNKQNPVAIMTIEGYGNVKIELYPKIAPESVSNFIALAQNGFYDGLKFHRVIEGFMIQGGDQRGDGTGTPKLSDLGINDKEDREYCIKGEFSLNGHENNIKHEKGIISMARADYTSYSPSLTTESYNSGGSQFFIMTKDNSSLDGAYAPFGKVIEGMELIEQIEKVEVYTRSGHNEKSTPVSDVIISKVTIETYGEDYGLPETLEQFDFYEWLYKMYGIKVEE